MKFSQDQLELLRTVTTNEVARLTKLIEAGHNIYVGLAAERIEMLKDILAQIEVKQ